jgi:hypothetical protein
MGEGCAHFEVLEHEIVESPPDGKTIVEPLPNLGSRSCAAELEHVEIDVEHQTVEVDTHAQIARTSTTRRSREKQTDDIPITYLRQTVDQRETEREIEHVEHRNRALDSRDSNATSSRASSSR